MQLPIENFSQIAANPFITGMQQGQQMGQSAMAFPQELQQAILNNQLLRAKAQYAQPLALAALQQAQKQQLLTGAEAQQAQANAALTGQHAQILQGQKPYLIQQEQSKLFAQPMLQRLYELQLAQKYGLNTSPLGFGSQQQPQVAASTATNPIPVTGNTAPGQGIAGAFDQNAQRNFLLFGTPYSPFQYAQQESASKAAGTTGVGQYKDYIAEAQKEAADANNLNLTANQYSQAYDQSKYKGGILGGVPTTGWESGIARAINPLFGKTDMSPEQLTDMSSKNLVLQLTKQAALGRFTNMEMANVQNAKPSRLSDEGAKQQMVNFIQQHAVRAQEKLPFLNAAQQQGIDAPTAETAWNWYQSQRPVYDFKNNQPNTQYQGTAQDYLAPNVIQQIRAGQTPTPKGGATPQNQPPSGNTGNFQMPTFKNQADFQNWYRNASPQQQASAKQIIAQREQKSGSTPMKALPLSPQQITTLHGLFGG